MTLAATNLLSYLVILVGLLFGLIALTRFLARGERRRRCDNPRALFRALCRTHELDWSSRRLLRQIARRHQLKEPSRLFVDPELLDPTRLHPASAARQMHLHRVRRKLFAASDATQSRGH